jgi:hypothetical protein
MYNTSDVSDAGDTVQYTLSVVHDSVSSGAAYGVTISETHDSFLYVDTTNVTCTPACSGVNYHKTVSGSTLTFVIDVLAVGTSFSVHWQGYVIQSVHPAHVLTGSSLALTYNSSADATQAYQNGSSIGA